MKKSKTQLSKGLQQSPQIEGRRVTIIWKGSNPPQLMGDFTDWERGGRIDLVRAGRNVWMHEMELPDGAYMEYSFIDGDERIPDPMNPNLTPDGLGNKNNYFYMPGAAPTDLTRRLPEVAHGKLKTFQVNTWKLIAGNQRRVHLYQPSIPEPCPLLVVWDGREYFRRARLPHLVDNLVHQKRIRPIALAMVENSQSGRMMEYSCSDSTLVFLQHIVLPLAQEELNLLDISSQPGVYGVLGASMGGLMALYTGLRLSHIFGHVLSQSGGFTIAEGETVVYELVRRGDLRAIKIWMDVGLYDFVSLLAANRVMYPLLSSRGYDVSYREYPGGHNYPSWRDDLWRGLEYHFGQPNSQRTDLPK
jgi:enterochelin esterase family protein